MSVRPNFSIFCENLDFHFNWISALCSIFRTMFVNHYWN
jgi:hypothetical protein